MMLIFHRCIDIVRQHVAQLNTCTSPAICDPSITIFETDTGVVPDLSVFPPSGCFCIRYREKIERRCQNGCTKRIWSIFRFDHLENTFGNVILVKQSLVVARHNVAIVKSVFPFKEKKPIFTHWESLQRLIGRKNVITEVHDFDNLLSDSQSDLEPADVSQSHQTQSHDSSSRAPVDSVDLSSDDDEVENPLEQTFEDVQTSSVPSFNPLSSLPLRGSSEYGHSGRRKS
jgi:hypothetical protein